MDYLDWDAFAQLNSPARVRIDRRMDRGFQALASLVMSVIAFGGLAGCSTGRPQAPLPQTPLISIALTQLPPATLPVATSAQVSAAVNNDPANAGVDWIATCGSTPNCGSFFPAHTASGAATTFTAPTAVPAHTTIGVTALSSTDHSKAAASTVTVVSYVTSVTITNLPPTTAPAGSTITLSATVVGDPANLGVDWKADCGGVDCTPIGFHSASGGTVNFVIPSPIQLATIVGSTVTLTAYATADHSFNAFTTFVVASPILVNITQLPPSSMLTNASATLIAVVQNDPTNSGVVWSVSCSTAPCGTITPSQTASGATAVFTAPAVVPGSALNTSPVVSIAAQAVASQLASFTVGVTIVAPVSLTITQGVTNGTIVQGQSTSLIATVTNDPGNAGVDWSVTCPSPGNCGTFSPTHSASGSPTTYTAPATTGSVTITASSTADPTKTGTQTVAVTAGVPPNSLLSGNFVMLLSSHNSQNGAYVLGGIITGDGNGTITDATFDLVSTSGIGSGIHILPGSTYSIGPDGRGQIQLLINTSGVNFGVNNTGAITLSVVFATPQHAMLSESDSFGTASGTLDLQNAQSFLGSISPGVYSLSLSGSEKALPSPGYFVTSAITISSTTSYSYVTDQSDGGAIRSVPFTTSLQGLPNLASYPGGLYKLSSLNLGLPTQFNLDLWPVDATHFVVTDVLDSILGTPNVIVSGHLTLQPSTPTISGSYAFTETGATVAAQPQAAGGVLTCGAAGTLDVVPQGGTVLLNQPINATCGAVTNGRSLIAISGVGLPGINQFAAYPTVDQGLYLIELDGGASGTSGSSGAGIALPQTLLPPITSPALNGKYSANFSANTVLGSQAFAGQIGADGVSALTGIGDVNSFDTTATPSAGIPSLAAGFSGSYSSAADGRFPFTLTITPASGQPSPQVTNLNLACYLVDANTCMLLGLDATAPGTGILLLQNTGL
jgi:hypothetical protein